jgi:allantoicase
MRMRYLNVIYKFELDTDCTHSHRRRIKKKYVHAEMDLFKSGTISKARYPILQLLQQI